MSEAPDIIQVLYSLATWHGHQGNNKTAYVLKEAANRITALEAKLAEAERQKQEIARTALSLDGECQALMAEIARERARAEAAESRVKALEADLRDEQGHVKRLQKALAFWMPGVSPEIEEELNGRAGDDACLLAGYDGEHEEECWGDTMVSRVKALEVLIAALAPVEAK